MSRKKELLLLSKEELIQRLLRKGRCSLSFDIGICCRSKRECSTESVSANGVIENKRKRPSPSEEAGPFPKRAKLGKKRGKRARPFDIDKYHQRRVAMKVAYLGHSYHGFVVQEEIENTIEHQLFTALQLTRLVTDIESADYSRAGRTDKGVSSLGNVIALNVRSKLTSGRGMVSKPKEENVVANEAMESAEMKQDDLSGELDYVGILNKVLPPDIRVLSWCPVDLDFSARFKCLRRRYKYR